ncbi:transcriptional regulator/antitoxin, MazE [Pyrobaculum neutrophilum V24Sta]|uniref:Transcriptional regulator/antitoxin, MazE n=1 Tax=Pyrobaculum neutrophilum (strain DSM 2338 / JCM 9278 / NBRC 100436 / V24Sta) TaxID=444157 RepID=B1YC77_PYRNV|nr:transcriptional regulator/antitoxin, MazE [Pyrobaculum neutrophilum V24Sta]
MARRGASRAVLRVYKKGVVVLPKALREEAGIKEGEEVVAEVVGGAIVIRPLKPRVVDVSPEEVEEAVEEEKGEWDRRLDALGKEAGT